MSTTKQFMDLQSNAENCVLIENLPSTSTRGSLEEYDADAMLDYTDLIGICSDSETEIIRKNEVAIECLTEAGTSNHAEFFFRVLDLYSGANEYNIDDNVIVTYDKEFYPGVIIDLKDNVYLVQCMEKTGAHWK